MRAAVCVLATLSLCACGLSHRGTPALDALATRSEAGPLELRPGDTLIVDSPGGDVRAMSAGGRPPGWLAVIRARAPDADEADELLASARVVVERLERGLRVRLEGEVRRYGSFPTEKTARPTAGLTLLLPSGTPVRLRTGAGDVTVEGDDRIDGIGRNSAFLECKRGAGTVVKFGIEAIVILVAARGTGEMEMSSAEGVSHTAGRDDKGLHDKGTKDKRQNKGNNERFDRLAN